MDLGSVIAKLKGATLLLGFESRLKQDQTTTVLAFCVMDQEGRVRHEFSGGDGADTHRVDKFGRAIVASVTSLGELETEILHWLDGFRSEDLLPFTWNQEDALRVYRLMPNFQARYPEPMSLGLLLGDGTTREGFLRLGEQAVDPAQVMPAGAKLSAMCLVKKRRQ